MMASTERIGTGHIKENAADGAFIFHKLLVSPERWLLPILLDSTENCDQRDVFIGMTTTAQGDGWRFCEA
jgi:hypothetical protein